MNIEISGSSFGSVVLSSKDISGEDTTLDTPHLKQSRIFHIVKINEKEDLVDSEFLSNDSLPSEELLLNEKIEFIESNSDSISSGNVSLTYTKSKNTDRESSLGSQLASNIIVNTLPESNELSFSSSEMTLGVSRKSIRSHTLNYYDILRTPGLTLDRLRQLKLRTHESSECEIDYFQDLKDFECKKIEEKCGDDDLLFTSEDLEPIWEKHSHEKKCTLCKIC